MYFKLRDCFLQSKGKQIESPIITIEDRLLTGKKAKRHEDAGDALSIAEWQELPLLMREPKYVLYDVKNDSILYLLSNLDSEDEKLIKLSLRPKNGVIEIVSVFKIFDSAIEDGLKAAHYELIRE